MSTLFLKIGNVVLFVAVMLVNWSAMALPLFGRDTGEISDLFPTAITPAGYAFSIWGLIYTLLIGFVIVPFIPRYSKLPIFERIGPWFMISCVLNVLWLIFWHALWIMWSVVVMVALLISLMILYLRTRPNPALEDPFIRLFVSRSFSVYLGWISVATIVNISIALYNQGWDGWGITSDQWAMILLGIAGVLAFTIAYRYQDTAYGLVIAWASMAVAVNQQETYPQLGIVAQTIAWLIIANALFLWIKFWYSASQKKPS